MNEPISITVSANYISEEQDLQFRLFARNLLNEFHGVSDTEKVHVLRDEANRLETRIIPDGVAIAPKTMLEHYARAPQLTHNIKIKEK